jgi:hypothetical protein
LRVPLPSDKAYSSQPWPDNDVTGLVVGVIRRHHLHDRTPLHYLANLNRRGIGLVCIHPTPHIGIERKINRPQKHLAGWNLWDFGHSQLEICERGLAARS